jgi:hypothetical protein
MSCEHGGGCGDCGTIVIELLTGMPGLPGSQGEQGPQGPPGDLTSLHGDVTLSTDEIGSVATVVGIQSNPISDSTPASNQALVWNGAEWVPTTLSAGTY